MDDAAPTPAIFRTHASAALWGMGIGVIITCITYVALYYQWDSVTLVLFMPVLWASYCVQLIFGQAVIYDNWVAVLCANVLLYCAIGALIARSGIRGWIAATGLVLLGAALSLAVFVLTTSQELPRP